MTKNRTLFRILIGLMFPLGFLPRAEAQSSLHPLENLLIAAGNTGESTSLPGLVTDYPGSVQVTVITNLYTYPTSLSLNGERVAGSLFGGAASYTWSAATGFLQVPGTGYGISETGIIGGSYSNSAIQYNGSNVETAGLWDPVSQTWSFPGMNPAVPTLFATDYNSGWDITSDGSTIVGLQWFPGYAYSAFKWSASAGYDMIGNGVGLGSRASGISANGTTVFGWAQVPSTSRTPVIWYNNQTIFVDGASPGEAYGASPDGLRVTGTLNSDGFIWTPTGTTTFSNTLTPGQLNPTTILNDGTVFGYLVTAWPPAPTARRAFVREPSGVMKTFNDWAEARGLQNAQQWLFYSINDASEDGLKLVGAGINPQGQSITFLMTFQDLQPVFASDPDSLDFGSVPVGTTSAYKELSLGNAGGGTLTIQSVILSGVHSDHFILQDPNTYPNGLGLSDSILVSVAYRPLAIGVHQAAVEVETSAGTFSIPLSGTGTPAVGSPEYGKRVLSLRPVPAVTHLEAVTGGIAGHLRIFDSRGRLCMEQTAGGLESVVLDVSGLPAGLYRLLFSTDEGTVLSSSFIKADR